jgi:hypothetical protein
VEFKQHASESFALLSEYCDGSDPAVVASRMCDVPFIAMRQAPLNLVFDDLIVVQILATNKIGSGPWCEPNIIGVRIQTEPIIPPSAPVILEYSEFSIEIEVSILMDQQTGGSEILRYDLIWDLGSLGETW